MLEQITPVIITYNEAPNIARTLNQLRWARDILVVDSFSDDETLAIVSTFPQVRVIQRAFDNFANQCNYALEHGAIKTEWVLNLDADYVLTAELIEELTTLETSSEAGGYRAHFTYCINGRQLRSGIYPPVTVLFRRRNAKYRVDGHAHKVVVEGPVRDLQRRILHDDRKPLSRWLHSQTQYVELEAQKLTAVGQAKLGRNDRIRQWLVVAPPAVLCYCLFVRGGILDGWPGLYYACQRFLAELILALYLWDGSNKITSELESNGQATKEVPERRTSSLTT
jgi:glycosyltransferase involved in cell wall biosynthesis